MRLYSDTLTYRDLIEALPPRVDLAVCDTLSRPRKRAGGWNVSLTGTSPYASQMSGRKAATWDEWGVWMAELYRLDPDALIGQYGSHADFVAQTRAERDRIADNDYYSPNRLARDAHARRYAATHTAPWLDD